MAVNRRGVFFTIMALLVLAFILASESTRVTPITTTLADTSAARVRAVSMDNYLSAFEQHAAASMATAGYFTLQNLSGRVRTDKAYIKDMNASVRFCMSNDTYAYSCLNATQTLSSSINQLVDLADARMGITTDYRIQRVWVTEERPFEVIFWMNISYNVSDSFAAWNVEERIISAPVIVTGIEDPLFAYANGTGLAHRRNFSETRIPPRQFTNTTFYAYYTNRSYIRNPGKNEPGTYDHGPSVLQRYTGQMVNGSDCCGIETLLHLSEINVTAAADPRRVNWSYVDYTFFSRNDTTFDCSRSENAKFTVSGFPDHTLRMDNYHFFNTYLNTSLQINYTCS